MRIRNVHSFYILNAKPQFWMYKGVRSEKIHLKKKIQVREFKPFDFKIYCIQL